MRNANGTGPYMLERYEPDVRTVLKTQPRWWGWSDKRSGNVDEVIWLGDPLRRDAAGGADLGRGRHRARPAVPGRRAPEERRRARPSLQTADIGTAVPRLRPGARRARGQRRQGPEPVQGHARAPRGLPRDQRRPDRRRRCCAARPRRPAPTCRRASTARPPSSTSGCRTTRRRRGRCSPRPAIRTASAVTLDCVNVAWREAVCQAMTAMLTQVGIRTTLRSSPTNQFFPKLTPGDRQPRRVRLDRRRPTPGASLNALFRTCDKARPRHLQRRPLQQPEARRADRRDARRARPDAAPRDGRRRRCASSPTSCRCVPLYRRTLTWAMTNERQRRAMAERHARAALAAQPVSRSACPFDDPP